jgi:hypothetical protein
MRRTGWWELRVVDIVLSITVALLCIWCVNGIVEVEGQAPAGPLAAYAMENGTDSSGNNRNATLTATTQTPGKYNNALSFNGSTSRMTAPSMAFTNAFTLEAWVFLRASGTAGTTGPARPSLFATPSGWQAIVYENPDVLFLAEAGGFLSAGFTSSTTKMLIQVMGPTKVQEQVWRHVAAVYDGANLTLYVDGAQFARTPATGTLITTTSPLEIGGSQVDKGYLNGTIDDVRIYNRALSIGEIAADMQTPVDVVKEVVAGWDLEVFAKGANPENAPPIAMASFEKAVALCNLAPLPPPTTVVINPTTARVGDPVNAGRDCELAAQAFFTSVPLGTGYQTTAKARGVNGTTSQRSTISNAFDRVAQVTPPPIPGPPVILVK